MITSAQRLIEILNEPGNRLLYIYDDTGSAPEAQLDATREEARLIGIHHDPDGSRMKFVSDLSIWGRAAVFENIHEIEWVQEFAPTHIAYATDLFFNLPSGERFTLLQNFLQGKQLDFFVEENTPDVMIKYLKGTLKAPFSLASSASNIEDVRVRVSESAAHQIASSTVQAPAHKKISRRF